MMVQQASGGRPADGLTASGEPQWSGSYDRSHVLVGEVGGRAVIGKRPKRRLPRVPLGWEAMWRSAGFRREIDANRAATAGDFRHFRAPAFVSTDYRTFFCSERVEGRSGDVEPSAFAVRQAVLSLAEFQARFTLQEGPAQRLVLRLARAPLYGIVRRSLGAVRRSLGLRTALRCIQVAWRELWRQPPLPRSYAVHGDFSRRNTLVAADGSVYVIDFGTLYFDRRWPLVDVVYYVTTHFDGTQQLDVEPLRLYLDAMDAMDGGIVSGGIDPRSQIRIALLRRMIWRIAGRGGAESRQRNATFLRDVVLSDREFSNWFEANFGGVFTGRAAGEGAPDRSPARAAADPERGGAASHGPSA